MKQYRDTTDSFLSGDALAFLFGLGSSKTGEAGGLQISSAQVFCWGSDNISLKPEEPVWKAPQMLAFMLREQLLNQTGLPYFIVPKSSLAALSAGL